MLRQRVDLEIEFQWRSESGARGPQEQPLKFGIVESEKASKEHHSVDYGRDSKGGETSIWSEKLMGRLVEGHDVDDGV